MKNNLVLFATVCTLVNHSVVYSIDLRRLEAVSPEDALWMPPSQEMEKENKTEDTISKAQEDVTEQKH